MDIKIEELKVHQQFQDVLKLQDKIWQLSDRDKISPITLRSISMEYPLMGISLGAYQKDEMVGFVVCMPTRIPGTLFGLIMGVLPEYEGKNISDKLVAGILKFCIQKNITKLCWTFEPLDQKLAHFYITKYGAIVVKYMPDYYQVEDKLNEGLPIDRFIADISPLSPRVVERVNRKLSEHKTIELFNTIPQATPSDMPNNRSILIEIPNDYQNLKKTNPEKVLSFRNNTRILFDEYINRKKYFISDFISVPDVKNNRYFYLLENKSFI
ncbi:MAG: GNAT family N-acetyltransferase [Bacteroidales bacterium]|nr:GNAT family N-acetyltransferase [Bacteroidales bacterium]